jgi:hypothetical protein
MGLEILKITNRALLLIEFKTPIAERSKLAGSIEHVESSAVHLRGKRKPIRSVTPLRRKHLPDSDAFPEVPGALG